MLFSDSVFLYLLLASNFIVYILLAAGLMRGRRGRLPKNPSVEDAFHVLELSLNRAFSDLPPGFTWNEVMNKMKSMNLNLDWYEIESTFKKYEDYRYGGIQYKNANVDAILKLAAELHRGENRNASIAEVQRT